jgi:hypothetical protein
MKADARPPPPPPPRKESLLRHSLIREKWIINPRISIDRLLMEEKQQRR